MWGYVLDSIFPPRMHSLVRIAHTPEGRKCDTETALWEVGSARVVKQAKGMKQHLD